MEVAKGKLIDIIDAGHILFETNKEKLWLGTMQRFGLNLIGKDFIANMIPRYYSLGLTENVEGKFKLIYIKHPGSGKSLKTDKYVLYLYFKEHKTDRIIELTKFIEDAKPFILGTNYDLDLVEKYKGLNPLPNLIENKTKDNELVYILSSGEGYLAQWGNKTISIHSEIQLERYLGKSVFIQLFRKKLSPQTYYFDDEIVTLPRSNFLFKSAINNNLLCINAKQQTIIESKSIIFSYDSGANIDMSYIPIYIGVNTSLIKTTKNKGYLLSLIINYSEKSNYLFINSADNTDKRLLYFPIDIELENAIGQHFTFESYPLFTINNISALPETIAPVGYLLETILNNNLFIFSKDAQQYLVEIKGFNISPSKTGKYFSLDLVPIIREVTTLDFEAAK